VEIIIIVTKDKLMIAVKAVIEVGRSCTSYGETLVGGNFDRVNRTRTAPSY